MKKTIALISLIIVPALTYAGGMVVFEKATGNLFEKVVTTLTTNTVEGVETITTNIATAWQKIHPQIRWEPAVALGQQVYAPIDWAVYDVAIFETASPTAVNIIDLTGVVAQNVQAQFAAATKLAQDKIDLRNEAEQSLIATATQLGVTNRPVPMTVVMGVVKAMTKTDPQTALGLSASIQADVMTFTLNGGDVWKIGAAK